MIKKIYSLLSALLLLLSLTACSGDSTSAGSLGKEEANFIPVILSGGSGKAAVESPAEVREENGVILATIKWNSPHYDYMIVDNETYYPVNTEGNSTFEIPIPSLSCTLSVQADTTAMSTPHLIDYTLSFGTGEQTAAEQEETEKMTVPADPLPGAERAGKMDLRFASKFQVDYYAGGLSLITIDGTDRYLLLPEDGEVPENLASDVTVLRQPLRHIYLVSSSAMDMFRACNAMDSLSFCALAKDGWYLEAPVKAMEKGTLSYAGKYSAPDYEMLRDGNCSLAVENTMIYHSPEVVENLEGLNIPVMIEKSSYEETPQGRMEWIKLYGLLTGQEKEAEEAFRNQTAIFDALEEIEPSSKTAAVFYVTSNGTASVRNASDYLPKMITLAGGNYAFDGVGAEDGDATTTIGMEEFYAVAKNADVLLYNGTISGELDSLSDFLALSPLFKNMKAVKEGQVYVIAPNLYQSSMELGDFTMELARLFRGETEDFTYIRKLS